MRRCLTVPTPPHLVQTTRSRCRWAQHSKIISHYHTIQFQTHYSLPYNSIPNLLITSILVFFSGKYLALVVPPVFLQHLTEDSLSWDIFKDHLLKVNTPSLLMRRVVDKIKKHYFSRTLCFCYIWIEMSENLVWEENNWKFEAWTAIEQGIYEYITNIDGASRDLLVS